MSRISAFRALALAVMLCIPLISRGDIRFAVVGGMSGQFEQIGTWFKQGARGAVEEINASGGLLGEQVEFVVRDDQCDVDKATEIAEELVEEQVSLVVGHLCSDPSIAASSVYSDAGIVTISPASTSPKLTDRGLPNVFRTIGRDDMQGFVLAEHIVRNFKAKKIAIVYDGSVYSRGVAEIAKQFLNQAGVEELIFEQAPPSPYDFTDLIERIEEQRVRVLLYPAMPDQFASIVRQLREQKARVRLIGGDTFTNVNVVLEEEELGLLDGVQFSFPPDPSDDPRNKAIVDRYRANGFNPEAFTFYSYAAVQVWALAVREVGTVDAGPVSEVLKAETFDTVLGDISFDSKGDITSPGFVMFYYSDGKKYYFE
jgi:branched-chain amino acid transport system substrate-binding protein